MFTSLTETLREGLNLARNNAFAGKAQRKPGETFYDTGRLTAEEWITAGDALVRNYPAWKWRDADSIRKRNTVLTTELLGDEEKAKKQYLICEKRPCYRRANKDGIGEDSVVGHNLKIDGTRSETTKDQAHEEEDTWFVADVSHKQEEQTGAKDSGKGGSTTDEQKINSEGGTDNKVAIPEMYQEEEIADMEDDDDEENAREAVIPGPTESTDETGKYRTYKVYIAYNAYEQTPWLFLSAYDKAGDHLLDPRCMYDDIYLDDGKKTATLQSFPHINNSPRMIEIHPCNHAPAMKALIQGADEGFKRRREKAIRIAGGLPQDPAADLDEGNAQNTKPTTAGNGEGKKDEEKIVAVEEYLVLFLKLATSLVPTIDYDYTGNV